MMQQRWCLLSCWVLLAACERVLSFVEEENPAVYAEVKESFFNHYDRQVVFPTEIHRERLRPKRSTTSRGTTAAEPPPREFAFGGFDESFHLELSPNRELLAPGFKVYRLNHGLKAEPRPLQDSCLFRGGLRGRHSTAASLNLCGGMTGLIRTENAEYLIEPLHREKNASAATRAHVLKRRSVDRDQRKRAVYRPNQQTHFCGRKRRYMPRKPRRRDYWLSGEFQEGLHITRHKRATSKVHRNYTSRPGRRRSVETLVVADRAMVLKHGADDVTAYLLTVFNMVSMLYQDPSIGEGGKVGVTLVGLVLLEGDEPGLTLSHSAEGSLSSFCQWQSAVHTSGGGKGHDHAVLVTGLDICSWKDEPCDTLGYAPISGMCSKYRSCTVNEDSGLALAFTVAHEVGHNFGMLHDGQGSSPCRRNRGTLMSASLSGLDTSVLWSECSRKDLARFLQSSRSSCLSNEPDSPGELRFPDRLPGQLYDADVQCKLQFGNRSRLCSHRPRQNEVCRSLWCQRNGRECQTKFLPAAEGTPCGHRKWCRKGSCVDRGVETLEALDGGWGEWSQWSNCSRSCDGALKVRERVCDSPRPQNGGNYCKGEEKDYRICATEKCELNHPERKSDQCSTFDKRAVKGKLYKWKPYGKDLGALSRCRIYCVPDKEDLSLVLSTKLEDGTSCSGHFSGVCIDGECRNVGCDGKVDSEVTPDYCGVCNGDNSTCRTVRGSFRATNLSAGYHEVVRIPANSRHLHVSESGGLDPPYLSVREWASGRPLLNGRWIVDWPGRYRLGGAIFSYRRWPGKAESLVAKGPTMQDLVVEVLLQEGEEASIRYRFVVANRRPEWRRRNSSCSVTCGKGTYTANPVCVDAAEKVVDNLNCDKATKLAVLTHSCFERQCPLRWRVGEWSRCDAEACEPAWQHRTVYCAEADKEIEKIHCGGQMPRPADRRQCPRKTCSYTWFAGPWSKCRGICSNGFQTRSVTCRLFANGTADGFSNCDPGTRPPHMRKCKSDKCSVADEKSTAFWVSGPWTQCDAKCGFGRQTRNVSCVGKSVAATSRPSDTCDDVQRPGTRRVCILSHCDQTTESSSGCTDFYEWCPRSSNDRLCKLKFYAINCCKTCTVF